MALNGSGQITKAKYDEQVRKTSVQSYAYCTPVKTSTDAYSGNEMIFSEADIPELRLSEIWIVNTGSNPIAFQWAEETDPAKDHGMVLGNDKVFFRTARKYGIRVRSMNPGSASTFVVFGL